MHSALDESYTKKDAGVLLLKKKSDSAAWSVIRS